MPFVRNNLKIQTTFTALFGIDKSKVSTPFNNMMENDGTVDWALQNVNTITNCPMRRASNNDNRAWSIAFIFEDIPDPNGGFLFAQTSGNSADGVRFFVGVDGSVKIDYGTRAATNQLSWNYPAGTVQKGWNAFVTTFSGGYTDLINDPNAFDNIELHKIDMCEKNSTLLSTSSEVASGNGFTGSIDGAFYTGSNHNNNFVYENNTASITMTNSVIAADQLIDFIVDPLKWKLNNTVTDPDNNKIWLCGDGVGDLAPDIFNVVDLADTDSILKMSQTTLLPIPFPNIFGLNNPCPNLPPNNLMTNAFAAYDAEFYNISAWDGGISESRVVKAFDLIKNPLGLDIEQLTLGNSMILKKSSYDGRMAWILDGVISNQFLSTLITDISGKDWTVIMQYRKLETGGASRNLIDLKSGSINKVRLQARSGVQFDRVNAVDNAGTAQRSNFSATDGTGPLYTVAAVFIQEPLGGMGIPLIKAYGDDDGLTTKTGNNPYFPSVDKILIGSDTGIHESEIMKIFIFDVEKTASEIKDLFTWIKDDRPKTSGFDSGFDSGFGV